MLRNLSWQSQDPSRGNVRRNREPVGPALPPGRQFGRRALDRRKMQSGRIDIHGHSGRHLGSELRGGEIHVHGNAGSWVGAEMQGGLIHVHGNSGHLAGAAYRGSPKGMTGGTLLIDGNAGNEIGALMPRPDRAWRHRGRHGRLQPHCRNRAYLRGVRYPARGGDVPRDHRPARSPFAGAVAELPVWRHISAHDSAPDAA